MSSSSEVEQKEQSKVQSSSSSPAPPRYDRFYAAARKYNPFIANDIRRAVQENTKELLNVEAKCKIYNSPESFRLFLLLAASFLAFFLVWHSMQKPFPDNVPDSKKLIIAFFVLTVIAIFYIGIYLESLNFAMLRLPETRDDFEALNNFLFSNLAAPCAIRRKTRQVLKEKKSKTQEKEEEEREKEASESKQNQEKGGEAEGQEKQEQEEEEEYEEEVYYQDVSTSEVIAPQHTKYESLKDFAAVELGKKVASSSSSSSSATSASAASSSKDVPTPTKKKKNSKKEEEFEKKNNNNNDGEEEQEETKSQRRPELIPLFKDSCMNNRCGDHKLGLQFSGRNWTGDSTYEICVQLVRFRGALLRPAVLREVSVTLQAEEFFSQEGVFYPPALRVEMRKVLRQLLVASSASKKMD